MAIRCLFVLPLCAIGRNQKPGVNILEQARKPLKNPGKAVRRGDVEIMNGKGTA
jgi:hypothetical protein